MYIYSIYPKDGTKEIYIGKTNNIKQRMYSHKSCVVNNNPQHKYVWMKSFGWNNLEWKVEEEFPDISIDRESYYINVYKDRGYKVFNDQLNDYHPLGTSKFNERDLVWQDYSCTNMGRKEICDKYSISDSLLSKIIIEHGGSVRKDKLYEYYDVIKQEIMNGVPIRALARKYNVCKNAIANINRGITAYDPALCYPLNQYVVSEIMQNSYFKPKV